MPVCLPWVASSASHPDMKSLLRLACLATAMAAASLAPAQTVVLHFTGWAQDQILGYRYGQSYTIDVAITDSFTSTHDLFSAVASPGYSENKWAEKDGDSQLFTSISGMGVTGTFAQPDHPDSSLDFQTNHAGFNYFKLTASTTGAVTGLKSLDGTAISFYATTTAFPAAFEDSPSNPQPGAYFFGDAGSYAMSNGYFTLSNSTNTQVINFTLTNLTISAPASTPVPEPATYAVLAGLAALGLALYRRRSRR